MIVTVWPFPTQKRMTVFTVHEPPSPSLDRLDRAEEMVFLKDGFVWSAFLFGPLWLLANRLWLATAAYLVTAAIVYFVLDAIGIAEAVFGPLLIALNAIVAFEAHWLKANKLEAKGWSMLGSVSGRGLADCERRFFEGWLQTQPVMRREIAAAAHDAPAVRQAPAKADEPKPMTGTPAAPSDKPKRRFAFFRRRDS